MSKYYSIPAKAPEPMYSFGEVGIPAVRDYQELLRKYMAHIIAIEGEDYLDRLRIGSAFTPAERAELERISKRVRGK